MKPLPACIAILLPLVAFLTGCGPMSIPMVERLEPVDQGQVDGMWNNMLTPVSRLDRETLLDTLVTYQLHQQGIDRLTMVCEKSFAGGRVVYRLSFDRAKPAGDVLEIDVLDSAGRRVRSEEYSGPEVLERKNLHRAMMREPEGWYDALRSHTEYMQLEARLARITAATQPATAPGE